MPYKNYHSATEYFCIIDDSDCREKLCVIMYDDLDVEFQIDKNKLVIHGIMYNFYLCKNYETIIENLNSLSYCTTGFIESESESDLDYEKKYKINVGDYCVIKESYKDELHGFFDKIVVYPSRNKIQFKSGWIRRENLFFLDILKENTLIEKCSCDE